MGDQPQGNDPPNGSQGEGEQPEGFSTAQLKAIAQVVNAAFSNRKGEITKATQTLIEGNSATLLSKVEELLSTKLSEQKATSTDKPNAQPETSPEMLALKKKHEALEASFLKERADKEAERAKARDRELRSKTQEALVAAGVSGTHLRAAMAMIVDSEKRIRFDDENDRLLFRDGEDDLPFSDGIKSWLKSEDAKAFLPPRGTQGTGASGGGRPPRGDSSPMPTMGSALLKVAMADTANE